MRTRILAIALASTLWALTGARPAPAAEVRVVQYHHPGFEHYFMTADAAEITALDAATPPSYSRPTTWARTGFRFVVEDAPLPGTAPVCRFYTDRFLAKASHFFTASADECAAVKANPDWTYEGIVFHAWVPDTGGACAEGQAPVHRLYNGGRSGAPNHAYTVTSLEAQRLVALGFVPEGIAFCVRSSATDAATQTAMLAGSTWSFPPIPEIFNGSRFVVAFEPTVRTGSSRLASMGLRQIQNYVYHQINDGSWTSYTGWDPLAHGYVLAGGNGFEGGSIHSISYQFDDVDGDKRSVYTHFVWRTSDEHRSPLQAILWSGCRPGEMLRP